MNQVSWATSHRNILYCIYWIICCPNIDVVLAWTQSTITNYSICLPCEHHSGYRSARLLHIITTKIFALLEGHTRFPFWGTNTIPLLRHWGIFQGQIGLPFQQMIPSMTTLGVAENVFPWLMTIRTWYGFCSSISYFYYIS